MQADLEGGEQSEEAREVLLERLKNRISKMQLTKLYSRLVRLMSGEEADIETAILIALENTEEKRLDVAQVLEDLIVLYRTTGDKQSVTRAEAELNKVMEDTDTEIATVREFLSSFTSRASSIGSALSKSDLQDAKASNSNKTCGVPVKGAYRNLERIKLPKFNGDKSRFQNFWATFESIVDETDEPAKYKMLRLKTCLEGKAEEAISKLGFADEAYAEAKSILKRRFGGERSLEEIKKVKPLQEGNIQELQRFADILVTTVETLREHNRASELEPGSLLFSLVVENFQRPCCQDISVGRPRIIAWSRCRRFEIGLSRNQSTKLKPWKALKGSDLKPSTRRKTVERIVPLLL